MEKSNQQLCHERYGKEAFQEYCLRFLGGGSIGGGDLEGGEVSGGEIEP